MLRDGLLAHFVRALLTQCDEYFVEFLHERGIVDPAKLGLEVVVRKVVGVREFDGVGRDFVGLVVVLVFALPNALPKILKRQSKRVGMGIHISMCNCNMKGRFKVRLLTETIIANYTIVNLSTPRNRNDFHVTRRRQTQC